MLRSRARGATIDELDPSPQLRLDIDDAGGSSRTKPIRAIPWNHDKTVDPILWMRDLQTVFDVHRCTIHRWIKRGDFPPKDAPAHSPRGWLRSTVVRWQKGRDRGQPTSVPQRWKSGNARL